MKLRLILFSAAIIFGVFIVSDFANAAVDYNCYCLNGSWIPAYYPKVKELNTANFDSCNQECANFGSKYFSFSTVSHAGVTRVSATPQGSGGSAQTPQGTVSDGDGNPPSAGTGYRVPGTQQGTSKIITCGRSGQRMCTLCDIIVGINNIIRYGFQIAIVIALTAISIGGVMYTVSAGDSKATSEAKGIIKNAAVGMVIVFAAWLIVNYSMILLGAKSNLGITRVQGWFKFDCNRSETIR